MRLAEIGIEKGIRDIWCPLALVLDCEARRRQRPSSSRSTIQRNGFQRYNGMSEQPPNFLFSFGFELVGKDLTTLKKSMVKVAVGREKFWIRRLAVPKVFGALTMG